MESESDEDSQDRHGEMEIKASSPLIFDDPDIDDLLQHQVDSLTSESARIESYEDGSQREDHFMQEKIEKLQSMMQRDLTSRLMSQAAKRVSVSVSMCMTTFYVMDFSHFPFHHMTSFFDSQKMPLTFECRRRSGSCKRKETFTWTS